MPVGTIEERYRMFAGDPGIVPEIQAVGHVHIPQARTNRLFAHAHAKGWEITLVERGELRWDLHGVEHRIQAGSVFIAPPDAPHGNRDGVLHRSEFRWVQVVFPKRGPLPGWSAADTALTLRSLRDGPAVVRMPDRTARDALRQCLELHRNPQSPFTVIQVRQALAQILMSVVQQGEQQRIDPMLMTVAQRLRGGSETIAQVAASVGWSASYVHAQFRAHFGESPAAWVRRQHLAQAKQGLRQGLSSQQVANQCGFASVAAFRKAFTQQEGLSPAVWLVAHRVP